MKMGTTINEVKIMEMEIKTTRQIKRMKIGSLEGSGDVKSTEWIKLKDVETIIDKLGNDIYNLFDNLNKEMNKDDNDN